MPIIHDQEFGKVTIRKRQNTRNISLRLAPDGSLRVTVPTLTPNLVVRQILKRSRNEIKQLIKRQKPTYIYKDGMQIGKSHHLVVKPSDSSKTRTHKEGQSIVIELTENDTLDATHVSALIRAEIINALRLEAKSYLPRRLDYLAKQHNFDYSNVRFSHASSRWGSCSSRGTISLNIALMKLPFEVIDYVIIHELSHTVHLNHSRDFWDTVSECYPDYKKYRKFLKDHDTSI